MNLRKTLIIKYEQKADDLENDLNKKKLEIGGADSGKESRYPTGRVELEDTIMQMENRLFEVKSLLKSLKDLPIPAPSGKVTLGSIVTLNISGESKDFVVIKGEGNFSEGILSVESPLGKAVIDKKPGEKVQIGNSNTDIGVIRIY